MKDVRMHFNSSFSFSLAFSICVGLFCHFLLILFTTILFSFYSFICSIYVSIGFWKLFQMLFSLDGLIYSCHSLYVFSVLTFTRFPIVKIVRSLWFEKWTKTIENIINYWVRWKQMKICRKKSLKINFTFPNPFVIFSSISTFGVWTKDGYRIWCDEHFLFHSSM